MNEINFLLRNRDVEFSFSTNSVNLEVAQTIPDSFYIDFVKNYNGGLFFNRSLQIYGYTGEQNLYSLDKINKKINFEYDLMAASNFFFACDVFGNQFCFDFQTGKIYLFNIESARKEFIADNFIEWIQIIKSEIDYYTGQPFIMKWEEIMGPFNYDERLTPKIPFVVGGEYHPNNLRVEKLDKILEFNSTIAKQIFDLPDGTKINIKLD